MAIASLAIALLSFVASLVFNRRTETSGLLSRAEEREANKQHMIEKLEKDLEYCRKRVQDLLEENMILLRKIAGVAEQGPMVNDTRPKEN
jgi:uncharacterized protein YlxW (UPF0749 family)